MTHTLIPGTLTALDLKQYHKEQLTLSLNEDTQQAMQQSANIVSNIIASGQTVYGINTGFGSLADHAISADQLATLQHKAIISHCAGVGKPLAEPVVRLAMLLKINTLAQGYSGIRPMTVDYLVRFYNEKYHPVIPTQGSVGASGDLAPLAALSATLMGIGDVTHDGKTLPATQALEQLHLEPLTLAAKEGLALLNGTQISTALALHALFQAQALLDTSLSAGALSVEAVKASHVPFYPDIHRVRRQQGQMIVAQRLLDLLEGSDINLSHTHCKKVQDPYSLRCQPQVLGACLDSIEHVEKILVREANAVTDNPLIFSDDLIISGGNFHAEPVAQCADQLAVAIAEMGAISERRINVLTDAHFSGLPAFLVNNSGLNSGFMLAQVSAAALASENKSYAHPASVDSIPTSANQEDHVSMATFAAQRLQPMLNNTRYILAIELLSAAQGIDFQQPVQTSEPLQKAHAYIREHIAFYDEDRSLTPDIERAYQLINTGWFASLANGKIR